MSRDSEHMQGDCTCCDHDHDHGHGHDHDHCHDHSHGHGGCQCCSHAHSHEHHHDEISMRSRLVLIVAALVMLGVAMLVEHHGNLAMWQLLLVYLVPYLLVGWSTLREAAEGLMHGEPFNEHFLMSVATIGALAIGFLPGAQPEMTEAVAVMLFFQVGELFEGYAEGKSRQSIAHLMNLRPDSATVMRHGAELVVAPDEVTVGETIVVRPGDRVPLDGVIIEGTSALDTVALTGESMPRDVAVGDEVISGCVNLTGALQVRTTKAFGESTVTKIMALVENADESKSRSEAFITRFARIYTPVVTLAAVALALLPPLLSGHFADNFAQWLYRALMFLVVSCPCALVISVPLTFFGGIGAASRRGVLVKGARLFDVLAGTATVVFDKTGTLTEGRFIVTAVHPESCDERRLLHLAAHVEHFSTHPIGAALRAAFPDEANDGCEIAEVEQVAGRGIRARVAGERVLVGNAAMMEEAGCPVTDKCEQCQHNTGTVIHVAIEGVYAGHIVIGDQVRNTSAEAIDALHKLGVRHTVMLTGDREAVARKVADDLHIDEWHAELLPADKVAHIERLMAGGEGPLAMVGDGINDAPVLARADVGIAMGGLGSDAAIEAADVVLMDDKPEKIADAIAIARRTLAIAKQNVVLAIGVKLAVLALAAFGMATMWEAVFADVGVTVIAVFNAIRAMSTKQTT